MLICYNLWLISFVTKTLLFYACLMFCPNTITQNIDLETLLHTSVDIFILTSVAENISNTKRGNRSSWSFTIKI